jgi:hypothetical protein
VPFRLWLTSPACEVLDVLFAMATSKTREQCARRIIYEPPKASCYDPLTYRPVLVGEDFLYKTEATLDLAGARHC